MVHDACYERAMRSNGKWSARAAQATAKSDRQTVRSRRIIHRALPADETRIFQDAQNAKGEGVETRD